MTTDFPSNTRLLEDLMSQKPDTHRGMWDAAEHVVSIARGFELGTAQIFEYRNTVGDDELYPIVVIDSPAGSGSRDRETVINYSHLDVIPRKRYAKVDRNPFVLEYDNETKIGKGLGSIDMLAGVVASIRTHYLLKKLGVEKNYRTVISSLEEDRSQAADAMVNGTYAKQHEHPEGNIDRNSLDAILADGTAMITHEITVNDSLTNPNPLYRARTGRQGFFVTVKGLTCHAGKIMRNPDLYKDHVLGKMEKVRLALAEIRLGDGHPKDTLKIFPESCFPVLDEGGTESLESLTVSGEMTAHFDVFTIDPSLSFSETMSAVKAAIKNVLSEDEFSIKHEERGGIPFTNPWILSHDHNLVKQAEEAANLIYHEASSDEIYGDNPWLKKFKKGQLKAGAADGVADDGKFNLPVIGHAPIGEDAHTVNERLWIPSMELMALTNIQMLKFEGSYKG